MIDKIISEIEVDVKNECFISALALALTLPDICGKAEFPKDKESIRYKNWYDTYIGLSIKPSDPYGADMPYLSGEVVYKLRCSLLHQGTPNIEGSQIREDRCKVDRFILELTDAYDEGTSMVAYNGGPKIARRELTVNVLYLINKIVKEAKTYYEGNKVKFDFFQYEWVDERTPNSVLWLN